MTSSLSQKAESESWGDDKFVKIHVLVVDDEPHIVKMVENVLQDMDIPSIYTASNRAEALDHFEGGVDVIDLVICGWDMPEMDGLQFLHHFRATHRETPVLLISRRNTADDIVAAKELGVSAYIVKPFNAAELREKVEKLATELLQKKESEPPCRKLKYGAIGKGWQREESRFAEQNGNLLAANGAAWKK